jgi:glutamine amidotransferase
MQILASEGDEFETTKGLNFIPGKVRKLRIASTELPQVGFNRVSFQGHLGKTEKARDFYFLNSYGFFPEYEASVLGTYIYGEVAAAVIRNDHVMGIQFHPEKSHKFGMQFFKNFVKL